MILRNLTTLSILLVSISAFSVQRSDLKRGLDLLYQGVTCEDQRYCYNEQTAEVLIDQALAFKTKFDDLIGSQETPKVQWVQRADSAKEFEFDSLVQRPGNHPSNKVKGLIFLPNLTNGCASEVPATLLVHKLGHNIDSEIQIAKMAAASHKGIVMIAPPAPSCSVN